MSERAHSVEEALESFLEQRRGGSGVSARAFAARYPELGSELLDTLESAEAIDRVRLENAEPTNRALPQRVASFRVVREIGRGGMGIVFEAIEEPLGRRVALKLLPSELLASTAAHERLRREAALAARIEHPGVCTVFGAGVAEGRPWLAMRFVEGTTLAKRIAASRARNERCVALLSAQTLGDVRAVAACIAGVARALAAAHAEGVLHRDVKPSNVMVTPGGEPVLLDFGLALEPDSEAQSLTRTGETAGTPAYLAPELLAGELKAPDERCDVYSLGVTLYECLALEAPFRAPTRESLYVAVLTGTPTTVSRDVPRDLAVIVATAMERDRARRYASAADLALDLEAFVAGRVIAARPVGSLGKLVRWARREPRQALLAGALVTAALLAALALGVMFASRKEVDAGRAARRAAEIEASIFDAFAAYGDMRFAEADLGFGRVLAIDSTNPDGRLGRVLLRIARGQNREALALLEAAPRTPAYDGLRAMARGEAPPLEDPEWLARATSFELFIDGDRFLIEAGRRPESERAQWARAALVRFENAVARAPQARGVYHVLWSVAASFAHDERAGRAASAGLVALWPHSARALYQAAFGIGDFDPRAAITILERALELDAHYVPALINLGVAHERLGDSDAACVAYERAIEVDPDRVEALVALANVQFARKCRDEARALLLRAVALDPSNLQAWMGLQSYATDAQSSVRAAERVLALDPGQTVSRNSYARALDYLGEHRAACEQFSICVAQAPRVPSYWLSYARTLVAVDEPGTALGALAAARALGATDADIEELEDRAREALDRSR